MAQIWKNFLLGVERILFYLFSKWIDYLVCCGSYDANWKGEDEGHGTSKEESPPWHLNLVIQEDAEHKWYYKCCSKQNIKPPGRYVLVIFHQPCMNILLSLVRSTIPVIYLPVDNSLTIVFLWKFKFQNRTWKEWLLLFIFLFEWFYT